MTMIVTDYTNGTSLKEHFKNKNITLDDVVDIISRLTESIRAIHTKGCSYNNLTPDNIFIKESEVFFSIKPNDFSDKTALFQKNDILALGLMIYEIFTDIKIFHTENFNKELTEPILINSLIPEEINNIIIKAIKQDDNSFKTMKEFESAVDRFRFNLNSHRFADLSLTGTNNSQIKTKNISYPFKLSDILDKKNEDKYIHFDNFSIKKVITNFICQKLSGVIRVESDTKKSSLYIKDGEFMHAEYNKKNIFPIDIFYETICWEEGKYLFEEDITANNYTFDSIPSDLLLMDSNKCIESYKAFRSRYSNCLIPILLSEKYINSGTSKVNQIMKLIDNNKTLEEIFNLAEMDSSSVLSCINDLFMEEIITFKNKK